MDEERLEVTLEEALRMKAADLLSCLNEKEPGTEGYSGIVDDFTKIYKLIIQENDAVNEANDKWNRLEAEKEKFNQELELKREQFDKELTLKQQQAEQDSTAKKEENCQKSEELADQKLLRIIGFGVDLVGIAVPIMFYSAWMKRGFKFEETGTFTSTTFRGLFSKFRPTK